MITMREGFLAVGAGLVLTIAAVPANAKDEVDRIGEKAEELFQKIQGERFSHMAEGKSSNLDRVYKDFDYLLKQSKNDLVTQAMEGKSGADLERLRRLNDFLLAGRIFEPVAASFDNAHSYQATTTMAVGDVELTLDTYEHLLANQENRSNRRIWYLASRDLRENFNVFEINLYIDLDRQSQQLTGKPYHQFLADAWRLDIPAMKSVCEQVLETTQSEYAELLPAVIGDAFDGLTVEDFREYDRPYLLRASHLDDTFPSKKVEDVADKWLKDLGLSIRSAKKLRLKVEDRPGMWPEAAVYPIAAGNDTRVSMVPEGGLADYWRLFGALGQAEFHYNIGGSVPFELRALGSPLHPLVYGALFQQVLADPGWRDRYLKVESDPAMVERAVRFRQLFDLRRSAANYLFQLKLYEDTKTPPSEYAALMQRAVGYSQGSTEETNYLTSQDLHESGMRVWASVLAAQLAEKLATQFGEDWWSKGEVGKWLRDHWDGGFQPAPAELAQALEIGTADPSVLSHP